MITLEMAPRLMNIIGRIDVKPVLEKLRELDLGELSGGKLSKEQIGILTMEIIADLTPQLPQIADDIIPLVALYKDITEDAAAKLDHAEVINDVVNDDAIRHFFGVALRRKVAQGA